MNIDMAHECQFLYEKTAGMKTRNILHCSLESVFRIQFAPTRLYPLFFSLKKRTTKQHDRIYII